MVTIFISKLLYQRPECYVWFTLKQICSKHEMDKFSVTVVNDVKADEFKRLAIVLES